MVDSILIESLCLRGLLGPNTQDQELGDSAEPALLKPGRRSVKSNR